MSQKPDPTDLTRAAARSTKFVLEAPPTRFTTRATKPTRIPVTIATAMPPSPAVAVSELTDLPRPHEPFLGLSADELEEYNEERWDWYLAMPGQLHKEFGQWLVASVYKVFRPRSRFLERFDLIRDVLERFSADELERDQLRHACVEVEGIFNTLRATSTK